MTSAVGCTIGGGPSNRSGPLAARDLSSSRPQAHANARTRRILIFPPNQFEWPGRRFPQANAPYIRQDRYNRYRQRRPPDPEELPSCSRVEGRSGGHAVESAGWAKFASGSCWLELCELSKSLLMRGSTRVAALTRRRGHEVLYFALFSLNNIALRENLKRGTFPPRRGPLDLVVEEVFPGWRPGWGGAG